MQPAVTSAPLDSGLILQWCIGILVVCLYSHDRFEKPSSVRWTTTFARYWFARTGYMAALIVLYLLLAGFFTDAQPFIQFFLPQSGTPGAPQMPDALPAPLFAALLLTSLLPHIPLLNNIDEGVKRLFQRIGNIPQEVRVLGSQLEKTRLVLPAAGRGYLVESMRELGIEEGWLDRPEYSLTHKWARIGLLYGTTRQWEGDVSFVHYVKQREQTFADISRRIEGVRKSSRTNRNGIVEDELAPVAEAFRNLSKELNEIHRDLCDLVAGGLLQVGRSPKQRQARLDELGFTVSEKQLRSPMSIHHIFLVGGAIFLIMLFASLIFQQFINPGPLNLQMRVLFLVPIIYCVSIMIAIFPKSAWEFANIQLAGQRPVMGYAASGAMAAAAAFIIQLVFRFVQGGNLLAIFSTPGRFTAALQTNLERWPWYFMTFFTTVAIAWAADNYYAAKEEPKWLRAAETLGLGLVFGLLQWIALELFELLPNASRWDGKEVRMIATSTLVGAFIGFFVPFYYRCGCRRERDASL
jgi:hypothetical protein